MEYNITLYSKDCPLCIELENHLVKMGLGYQKVSDINLLRKSGITKYPILEVDGVLMDYELAVYWIEGLGL